MNTPTNLTSINRILNNRPLLRDHKYTVNIVSKSDTTLTQKLNEVELMASSISIPTQSFQFVSQRIGGGVAFRTPSEVEFGDLGITFYNSGHEYGCIKGIFDRSFNPVSNTFAYRDELLLEIEVSEFNDSNEIIGVYAFFDCLLQGIGERTLAHSNGNDISIFTSTWSTRQFIYRSIYPVYNPSQI